MGEWRDPISIKDRINNLLNYAYKIGFFHLVSANVIIKVAGSGMQIILAKILPKEDIGRIAVLQSFLAIFVLIAQLGTSTAILKLCSENIEEEEKETLMASGIRFNTIMSVFIVMLVIVLSYFGVFSNSDITINQAMRFYIIHLPFVVLNGLIIFYLQSQHRIKEMSRYQMVTKILVIIAVLGFSALWGLRGYVVGIIISNMIGFVIVGRGALRGNHTLLKRKPTATAIEKLINYSKYAVVASIIFELNARIGVLMANYYLTDMEGEIGVYSLAVFMVNGLITIPASYNQIMVPKISHVSDDMEAVKKLYRDYSVKMFGMVAIMFVAAYFIVPLFFTVFYGDKYAGSIAYFKILSVGLLLWAIYSPIGNTLLSIGELKLNVITNTIVLTVLVVLNAVFIPKYSVLGLAYAYVIANAVGMVVSFVMIKWTFRRLV